MSKSTRTLLEFSGLQGQPLGESTYCCPDDDVISLFFDGHVSAKQREAISGHLSGCRYCRGKLGLMSRLEEGNENASVTEDYKAKAKQLGGGRPPEIRTQLSGWAAAAALFLAVGIWVGQSLEPSTEEAIETRQLRSIDTTSAKPRIVEPEAHSPIDPATLRVRWTPVAGSQHYELYLLSDQGNLLVHERLNDTWWDATNELQLQPAGEYYIRVEAHLDDATTLSSEHVLLTVKGNKQQ